MVVFLDDIQKFLNRHSFQVRFIAVPFQIGSLPEDFPIPSAFVVGRFRNRMFDLLACVFPMSTDFEYFDALSVDPKSKVNLAANVRWRSPPLYEFGNKLLSA